MYTTIKTGRLFVCIQSQIDHLDMHHLVFRINCQIHFVSLASLVSIYVVTQFAFSSHLCHHHHSQHPLLLHSFTPGAKPTCSTNPSHLNRLLVPAGQPPLIMGLTGLVMPISLFLVSFLLKFFRLFRVVD